MKYNRYLMQSILWDRIQTARLVGVEIIPLDDAPKRYAEFNAGAPRKLVIDPQNMLDKTA
jgi:glutathione-independent formaldehyde dehydrogenase